MLFNFDIDGDALKDEHRAFLREEALPTLQAGGSVSVIGVTDRSGTSAHNQALSEKRVARTLEFLRQEVPGLKLKQAAGFGEDPAANEGKKDGTLDERFRAVLVFLTAAPVVTTTKVIDVTAKSFIALIGDRVGTIPGFTVVVLPNSSVPIPVPRQEALKTLAKFTDAQFNENPLTTAKDKRYRLFSSCRFTVVFEDKKILAAVPAIPDLDTDVGKEVPCNQTRWSSRRSQSVPEEAASSRFPGPGRGGHTQQRNPGHRVWIDNTLSVPEQRQRPFSNLWVPDGADKTKVK